MDSTASLLEKQRQAIISRPQQGFPRDAWRHYRPYLYKLYAGRGSLSCAVSAAILNGGILEALTFVVDKDERLVGRLGFPPPDDEAEYKKGAEYFRKHPKGNYAPGQSGHTQVDFSNLLSHGILKLRGRIAAMGKSPFYKSCAMMLDSLERMIASAEKAASDAGNQDVAALCRRLRTLPPATFREAVQMLWFILLALELGDRADLPVPGRLDRILIPFYNQDIADGRLTRQEAVEILAQFYIYLNDMTPSGLAYSVMVGGDTVNDVSYIALEALRLSRLSYPSVGICVNQSTPESLKALAIDIISEGLPTPAFFNDRIIRQGLRHYGVPAADAGNYINSTCVEITPCGASNVYVASPYFNLCRCLLECMGESDAASWEAFLADYYSRLGGWIRHAAETNNDARAKRQAYMRRPLQSILTSDCLARGKDVEEGGARYNWVECSFVGLANLVDSLYVIREEVFNRGAITLAELKALCESDFAGAEELRLKYLNGYPKYGLADSAVDSLIPPVIGFIEETCAKYRMLPDDSPFIPGTFCWIMHQRLGTETCATPDGRRSGFPFADGAGPAQGREKKGPTSAVMSVCSWDHSRLIGGTAFNMQYSRSLLSTPEARAKLLALVNVFIQQGGFETQINVTDPGAYEKAMKEPEKYGDLIVRIGGYTDYFVRLSPQMQQEIMLRTRYAEL